MPRCARCLAALAWVSVSVGCPSSPRPPDSTAISGAHAMYPLAVGNAWSYDVDTGDEKSILAITRVEERKGPVARVRTGATLVQYELLPEGIRTMPEGAWLFRTPFVLGAEWPAPGGRGGTIVAVDSAVRTSAGSFDGCLEVLETGGELDLEIHTVYCPGVGPVSVESTMRSSVGDRSLTVSAKLRGYEVTLP